MNQTVIQLRGGQPAGVPSGTRLNDIYEIDEQIASGGMGEIYRGHLIETGDPVAIKMIKPELAGNEDVLALFRKEASALHHLHHDSIVRYYVFTVDRRINRPYLAMEFVEGKALSDLLKTRPLTLAEVNALRRRIASGLQAAHDKGIVHRDISPDNIIMPEDDIKQSKIIDFGIARSTRLGHQTIIGDGFAGKYNYVSPEQLGLFGSNVTNRSDIYSLALVLTEALLGQPIDMSGSQADVIDKRRQVPDLSKVDASIRPLLQWMLQPKPEDRPESMQVVADWVPAGCAAGGSRQIEDGSPGSRRSDRHRRRCRRLVPDAGQARNADRRSSGADRAATRGAARTDHTTGTRIAHHRLCALLRGWPVPVPRTAQRDGPIGRDRGVLRLRPCRAGLRNRFSQCERLCRQHDHSPPETAAMRYRAVSSKARHRRDGDGIEARIEPQTVKPGATIGVTLAGIEGKFVGTLLLSEDGRLYGLSGSIKRDGTKMTIDSAPYQKTSSQPEIGLLLSLITPQRLAALDKLDAASSRDQFNLIAAEVEKHGPNARFALGAVTFE